MGQLLSSAEAERTACGIVPVRLQLRRVKGFNLQALSRTTNGLAAVNCARPGPLGNPFHTHNDGSRMSAERAVLHFRAQLLRLGWFESDRHGKITMDFIIERCRGRNCACFCPIESQWCHVDTIIEIANR